MTELWFICNWKLINPLRPKGKIGNFHILFIWLYNSNRMYYFQVQGVISFKKTAGFQKSTVFDH